MAKWIIEEHEEADCSGEEWATAHLYCKDEAEARQIQADLQSAAGSNIERDVDFLYVTFPLHRLAEALKDLKG